MAVFYRAGETKVRPGVYQRYTNITTAGIAGAVDGICAIPIHAHWGPLGAVVKHTSSAALEDIYGGGDYASGHTVPAAAAMFSGGAETVYTYRLGTGGTKGTKALVTGEENSLTVTAKYPGSFALSLAVQNKLGDTTKKLLQVYAGDSLVESWEFAADTTAEGANLVAAVADSAYIEATLAGTVATVPILAAASGALTGGSDPSVTNADYSKAFAALEPYAYNCIALDVDDDENMTLSLLLQAYLDNAYKMGKLGIAVVGEKSSVAFSTRCTHAKAFNDAKVVYLGSGYKAGSVTKDGAPAICYTAGLIASTPSNASITHTAVSGATELLESLTYAQYEQAIENGMLALSISADGAVWYDSGVTTLTSPDAKTEDDGWKKIRRVKVRLEMFDRLDRTLAPKVGKVSADADGIADIIQSAQRVLDAMVTEGKIFAGASFTEDPDNPHAGDSAWFIIQADDIDSLEKIYLHYKFRYSQSA